MNISLFSNLATITGLSYGPQIDTKPSTECYSFDLVHAPVPFDTWSKSTSLADNDITDIHQLM